VSEPTLRLGGSGTHLRYDLLLVQVA
jgi:hypothetical protein